MNARILPQLVVITLALTVASAPADATTLEEALARMQDGRLRFHYQVREGVHGDGHGLNLHWREDDDWRSDCEEGPVGVELRVRDGEPVDLNLRVGGRWTSSRSDTVDLGEIDAAEAADFFLTLAETGAGETAEDAVLAAVVADAPDPWERLLRLARDRGRPSGVREQAVFWLGMAAGEKATEGISELASDDDESREVRKQAVFALSQIDGPAALDELMEIARGHGDPEIRRQALFWLAQRDEDEVLELFEEILLGG